MQTRLLSLLALGSIGLLSTAAADTVSNQTPFFVEMMDGIRQENGDAVDWAGFLGHFHVLTLHLPIGLLIGTFLLELYGIGRRKQDFRIATRFLLGLTVITAWVAVATGLFLSLDKSEGYNASQNELLAWHGVGALILAVLLTLAYLIKRGIVRRGLGALKPAWKYRDESSGKTILRKVVDGQTVPPNIDGHVFVADHHMGRPVGGRRFIYCLLMFASVGLISLLGHYGGSLVHGADHLSEAAPEWMPDHVKHWLGENAPYMPGGTLTPEEEGKDDDKEGKGDDTQNGASTTGGSGVSLTTDTFFGTVVQPIFERSCNKCHGADPKGKKPKGGYDMTKFDELVDAVKPGDAENSYLYELIMLPIDDDEHMPPEDKAPQLSDLEKEQVKWWIDNGAKERGALSDAPEKLQKS